MKRVPRRHIVNCVVLALVLGLVASVLPDHLTQQQAQASKLERLQQQVPVFAGERERTTLQPLLRSASPPSAVWQHDTTEPVVQADAPPTTFEAGEEGDPKERDRWFWEQRAFPKGSIPAEVQQKAALAELKQRPAGLGPQQAQWTNLGPAPLKNITYGGDSAQDTSGRTTAVAIHPANPNIMLIGAAQGGIWKSTDAGATFRSVGEAALPSLAIKVIRFAPADPQIIYAGTGEPHGSTGIYGMGVVKSVDGGETWQPLPRTGTGWDFAYASISGLQVDPANPNVVYVTTAIVAASVPFLVGPRAPQTGIFKSVDGGASWTLLKAAKTYANPTGGDDHGFMDLELGNATLLYASEFGGGVYTSTDAGATWTLLTPLSATGAGRFPVAIADYTYYYNGLFYLLKRFPFEGNVQNGGAYPDFSRIELAVSRADPQVVYAGYAVEIMLLDANDNGQFDQNDLQAQMGLLFKSTNGGQTWTWLGDWARNGAPDYCANQCAYDNLVEVNPTDPNDILIGGNANYNPLWPDPVSLSPQRILKLPWRGMINRSRDGGRTWTDLTPHCTGIGTTSIGKLPETNLDIFPCTGVDTALVIHPDEHNAAFDANGRIYVTNDGGVFRGSIGGGAGTNTVYLPLVVRDASGLVATATDGAASASVASVPLANDGFRWENLNHGLSTLQFYNFDVHPTNPDIVLGGLQDNSVAYFNGQVWDGWGFGDGTLGLFDPIDPQHVYMGTQLNVHRHDAGGAKVALDPVTKDAANGWHLSIFNVGKVAQGERVAFNPVFAIDPVASNIVYGASNRGLYKSTNRGDTWAALGTRKLDAQSEGQPTSISVSPKDHNLVYVSTSVGWLFLWDASTGQATRLGNTLPGRYMTRTLASPSDPNTVYAVYSGYNANTPSEPGKVFRSGDRGQNWTDISGNLPDVPVSALALDPQNPQRIWIGSDIGVFVTNDGGATWASYRSNMPVVAIMDMKYSPAAGLLTVATHGRGAWRIVVGAAPPPPPTATPVPTMPPPPTPVLPTPVPPTPTSPPTGGNVQLLVNGGFEGTGAEPWAGDGNPGLDNTIKHSGAQSVQFGGANNVTDGVYQGVDIPTNATAATFEFYYRVSTADTGPTDRLCFFIYEPSGSPTYVTRCFYMSQVGSRDWTFLRPILTSSELAAIRGKSVGFGIYVITDSTQISTVWVDDVAFNVQTSGLVTAPNPAPGSTTPIGKPQIDFATLPQP